LVLCSLNWKKRLVLGGLHRLHPGSTPTPLPLDLLLGANCATADQIGFAFLLAWAECHVDVLKFIALAGSFSVCALLPYREQFAVLSEYSSGLYMHTSAWMS
jgi:hypothetical protein